MLYEIRAFNAKSTVFRCLLDSLDIDILDRMTDAIDTDALCTRDEVEDIKVDNLKIIIRALRAVDSAEKGGGVKNE